ncbi:hypothetical protein [Okeania sp. SIO2B3]|uniref:hypothetical protein n=1 Tax=Okeania sp. SIO2B3 TaxID=2607784 RepID=UPI0013B93740|nr:hypothetical protein [Okeania sp. SIO2B3]NES67937.1 hypothetical protein [Okeania sp. SIO2D1]NET44438.1 hypothetical protein [Okeania sp. SIO2B3]
MAKQPGVDMTGYNAQPFISEKIGRRILLGVFTQGRGNLPTLLEGRRIAEKCND